RSRAPSATVKEIKRCVSPSGMHLHFLFILQQHSVSVLYLCYVFAFSLQKQMRQCMVRLIYCEMLGYEASFGYIHAIKLAQQGSLMEKRVGYLAVSLFLNESHELLLLLVNTVLKDLQSSNLLEVCMALTVASQIFPPDMIPAVLPLVEEKLLHSKEIIRRKAVLALHKFYLIAPNQVQHIHDKFRKALCDRDPGVMAASLHIYLLLIKENPEGYKDLTGSFVTILKQVIGGKLAVDFNYHSVPAPWLQIQLLNILRLLGKEDQRTSELMYDVLDESLRRAEMNHNITYAILFECIQTVYTIHPKSDLLEKAAKCNGKFILSPKNNLKYLGLKALTYVIQQDLNLVLQHQMTIIDCLDHPDPIIKRETLELLYRITNGQNVTVIAQKMLDYLRQSKDEYVTISLVGKVAELAEKYPFLFSVGGDIIQPDIPNNFLRLLAEGFEDEAEDKALRLYAVNSYLALLEKDNVHYPQRFLQVMSWVLGEYSYLKTDVKPEDTIQKLLRLLEQSSTSSETKAWILAAITKLFRLTVNTNLLSKIVHNYSSSMDSCLRQYAFELKQLVENKETMNSVLRLDASCEDTVVDASLSFLDGFVAEALGRGAAPYKPHHQRQEERMSQEKVLNFEPYGLSFVAGPQSSSAAGRQSPTGLSFCSEPSCSSTDGGGVKDSNSLKLDGVKKVWGKEGYLRRREAKEEAGGKASPAPEGKPTEQPAATPSAEEQEKQQLASSLFVGLGSNNSVNLVRNIHPFQFHAMDRLEWPAFPFSAASNTEDSAAVEAVPSASEDSSSGLFADGNIEILQPPASGLAAVDLPVEISEHAHSKLCHVCANETVAVFSCRVWKEDCLLTLLFLTNHSSSVLTDVTNWKYVAQTHGNSTTVSCQLSLRMEKPCTQVALSGHVVYHLESRLSAQEEFSLSLSLTDFIRPLRLSTEEFGQLWLSLSNDVKQNIRMPTDSSGALSSALHRLQHELRLHIVDIIGQEGIAACQLLPDTPCLLHCRAHAGTLSVWLRSACRALPDCLLYECQKVTENV
uniref:AP-4 complex subunit epsilon n=1 Tax=Callorhinchus milii TaxID=7868 RepID=A0A4W3KHW9_CALMI